MNHTPEPLQTPERATRAARTWIPAAALAVVFFAVGMLARPLLFSTPAIAEQLTSVQERIDELGRQIEALSAQLAGAQATLSQVQEVNLAALDASLNQMDKRLAHAETVLDELQQASTPTEAEQAAVSADDDPMLGNPDAPVLIVEFSDYQCPYCKRFEDETMPQILQTYVETGKAKVVYRDFPLVQIHPYALLAALASECADEQEAFWPYHDLLFARQSDWARGGDVKSTFVNYAAELSLDETAFSACVGESRYLDEVQHDFTDGASHGVTGTPSFFINGKLLVGAVPFSQFQPAIEEALSQGD